MTTSAVMTRHTTFRYCLDPTVEQRLTLARHAGASRFAYNQCLNLHLQARADKQRDTSTVVPWARFELINRFNAWKKSEDAGRVIAVDGGGSAEVVVTGLSWRSDVRQQVFEEAGADLATALKAWTDSRKHKRAGVSVGYPRFKKKNRSTPSFRLRNNCSKGARPPIRVGDDSARTVTLPGIGTVRVHDDTRRLRRLLGGGRAKILFATVSRRAGRWWVALNIEAADLHPDRCHSARATADHSGWVGIDRGLTVFIVAADSRGREINREGDPPRAFMRGLRRTRRLAESVMRKQQGSRNRQAAAARLARHHRHMANIRGHFLHQVSNRLVNTHDRLVVENLNVAGMLRNRRLSRAISDAGWARFVRLLEYKQRWRRGTVLAADRWFPSSKTCSACGAVRAGLDLAERIYHCPACGVRLDRDLNAAVNLAAWAETGCAQARDLQAWGPVINAHRQERSGRHHDGETDLDDVGTDVHRVPAQ
ncbi:RNA-guided endonuclease TnpB family protein [Nocardia asteroides]|uniref:RNA-guided endonuclease InsQ/TnpB family protein n=1 Tax=Nocardia asteroides TaxID=1824 RepID=UPI00343CD1A2